MHSGVSMLIRYTHHNTCVSLMCHVDKRRLGGRKARAWVMSVRYWRVSFYFFRKIICFIYRSFSKISNNCTTSHIYPMFFYIMIMCVCVLYIQFKIANQAVTKPLHYHYAFSQTNRVPCEPDIVTYCWFSSNSSSLNNDPSLQNSNLSLLINCSLKHDYILGLVSSQF